MLIKKFIDKLIENAIDRADYRIWKNDYASKAKNHVGLDHPFVGEQAWMKKWSRLTNKKLSPISYRLYSSYIGENINIVPSEICRTIIEPILTPLQNESFYNDKNSFGLLIPKELMPFTIARRINGLLFDDDYLPIGENSLFDRLEEYSKFIVKPTSGCSGRGISIFHKHASSFFNKEGVSFKEYIDTINNDYIIQECIEQSDFMAQFNASSVNTIRVNTYRDVKTGEIHVLGSVVRMGAPGSDVDNLFAGGAIIGVDSKGIFNKYFFDENGKRFTKYNHLDFENNTFRIPNYERVKEMCINISTRFPHQKLFAFDIALDKNNNPLLIEVNTHWYNPGVLQLNNGPLFGDYTDDVINFCLKEKERLRVKYTKVYNY